MATDPTIETRAAADAALTRLVGQLVSDAKEVAQAEVALAKAKASDSVGRYRSAAIFFAVAGVLALCGFIALLVGLILSLATLVGPGFATLIVVGTVLVVAALLAWTGKARLAAGSLA